MKSLIVNLLIVFFLLLTGCSNNVLMDEENSKLLNYNFKISDIKNIDKTLKKQRYSFSTNIDKKFFAIITYHSTSASMQQYLIDKDGSVNVTIPKDSDFIISLPTNPIVTYTWNIKNNINAGIVKFTNQSKFDLPMPTSQIGSSGSGYSRQNFYFKPLKSGNEKIVMRCEHQSQQSAEFFEVTFNIAIQS